MADNPLENLEDSVQEREDFFQALYRRNDGLLPKTLSQMQVLVVGLGSVGSYIAEKLVRAGVGSLVLIDHDEVEAHNLTRTVYRAKDIGKKKADCLKYHLQEINPWVSLQGYDCKLEEMEKNELRGIVKKTNLIVSGADNNTTTAILNRIAYHYDIMNVSAMLYKKAQGGEVVFSVPGITPCMECGVESRYTGDTGEVMPDKDYGTGNLAGELAIAPDVHTVSAIGAKICLSLLSLLSDEEVAMQKFIQGALSQNLHMLIIGLSPGFELTSHFTQKASGQYAFDSVWVTTQSREDCPYCGTKKEEVDPISEIQASIESIDDLRF